MATKQVFLLAFTSILLGYLWVRATCRQSIYCPWETAITSSAKQLAHAVSSGLDQLIVRRVTGSIAGFLELPMSASRRTDALGWGRQGGGSPPMRPFAAALPGSSPCGVCPA